MTRKTVSWIAVGIAALFVSAVLFSRTSPPGLLHTIQPHDKIVGFQTVALSPDGKTLATGNDISPVVELWDVETGRQTASLGGNPNSVHRILFSPSGDRILVVGRDRISRLWSLPYGHLLHTFPRESYHQFAAFTGDGIVVLERERDGDRVILSFHDRQDGSLIRTLEMPGTESSIWFAREGRYAFARDALDSDSGVLWDVQSGKPIRSFPIMGGYHTMTFSPDGRKLFGKSMTSISVWSVADGAPLATYGVPEVSIISISVSQDGSLILSGDRYMDVTGGSLIIELLRGFGMDIERVREGVPPAGAFLSCGKTGQIRRTFPGHKYTIHTVAFTPDTTRAITASNDRIQIWDISDVETEPQP